MDHGLFELSGHPCIVGLPHLAGNGLELFRAGGNGVAMATLVYRCGYRVLGITEWRRKVHGTDDPRLWFPAAQAFCRDFSGWQRTLAFSYSVHVVLRVAAD